MAVSFKVPASPAKSIFTIDEFLGVDLTNSPANIQDNRSPNAPNMTRLVPGKVRKRMGYVKEHLFGTRTNVNWANKTSYEEEAIVFTEDNINTYVRLYNVFSRMESLDGNPFTIYVEFDYRSEYDFDVVGHDHHIPASEEWTHFSGSHEYTSSGYVNWVSIYSEYEQTVYIKQFSIMYAKDDNYKWSPSVAKHMHWENSDEEVFGFHKYTSPSSANAMTDINRALSTNNTTTITTSTLNYYAVPIHNLAEKMNDGRKFRIKFDYTYTQTEGGVYATTLYIGRQNIVDISNEIGGENGHTYTGTYISDVIEYTESQGYSSQSVGLLTYSKISITFSNLSILYDMSDDYEWSAAPEDGTDFYYPDVLYNYGVRSYSAYASYSRTISTSAGVAQFDLPIQNTGSLKGYSKLSFELSVKYNNANVSKTELFILYYDAYSSENKLFLWQTLPGVQLYEGSFSFLLSPANTAQIPKGANWSDNNYIKQVIIKGTCTATNEMSFYFTNIRLQSATQKADLSEAAKVKFYHVGSKIFAHKVAINEWSRIAININPHRSLSWQFGDKLFLIDGKNNYLYNYANNTLDKINQTNAYIPIVTFAKSPSGGGTSYESLNLLQPGFYEMFCNTDASTTDFQLSFAPLDSTTVRVWKLTSDGEWSEYTVENTGFTVNRTTGKIHFLSGYLPGETPISGEDNVKILAYKTVEGYAERIRRCTFGALFGVNGASDRLFLSGNPDYPNYDWYSEKDDPTYFPDTGYSTLGLEVSAIVGYSLVNNYLATHKDENEPSQSVFIREGDLILKDVTTPYGTRQVSEPAFKLINTLQGAPAISPYTFGYVETEPLFLTKSGIFALTTQDITGDKYGQNRSFYLNGALTEESDLKDAYACIFDNMYYLAVNNKMYLIDGLQATRTDRSDPYSTRQYVGFLWDNIPATILFSDEGNLYFGTADGKICRFYKDVDDLESYNDDGYPIDAWWETPDLDGRLFYKNKTFRYYAARLMSALATSVKMWAMKSGAWTLIKTDNSTGRYFDFGNVNFEKFSFSTDQTEKVVHTKIKVKKVDKARFKLENDVLNEPFGLFNIALEYVENGNYKG